MGADVTSDAAVEIVQRRRDRLLRYVTPVTVVALVYLIIAGITAFARPTLAAPVWDDWWDQSHYWRSARAFARFDLRPDEHYYPILYPLLVAPFAWLPQALAFLIPDLACYVLVFTGFRRVAARLGLRRWPACALFLVSTLLPFWQVDRWAIPWTTTLSATLLWQSLAVVIALAERPSLARSVLFGALVVAIPFARPGDAMVGALIGLVGLVVLGRRRAWRPAGAAIGAGAGVLVVLGGLYLAIYGATLSSYARLSLAYGYDFEAFGWRAQVLLNSPRGWLGSGTGLIEALPWLPIGAAGLLYLAWRSIAERSLALAALPAAVMLYALMMLAYTDLLPPGLWEFDGVHYFKWLFPGFALAGVAMLMAARRRPVMLLPLLPLVALSFLHLEPVAVGKDKPAKMVAFAAPPGATNNQVYFAASVVADRAGVRRNIFDYRQVRDGAEMRAVALRRDFAGDERWIGNAGALPVWPDVDHAADRSIVLNGAWPQPAIARYGTRLTIGWPCWLIVVQCERR